MGETKVIAIVTLCLLLYIGNSAQGKPLDDGRHFSRERMEMLRTWRLVDELEVDVEQATVLFPLWSQQSRQIDQLRRRRSEAANTLQALLANDKVEENVTDSDLLTAIDGLETIDRKIRDTYRAYRDTLSGHLSVRQRAILVLFPDHFRRDLKEIVQEFRGRGWGSGEEPRGRRGRRWE